MITTRNIIIALLVVVGVAAAFHFVQKYRGADALVAHSAESIGTQMVESAGIAQCRVSEEACLNDSNCMCYCSVKCGPRKKEFGHSDETKNDKPVMVNGICFCKQWDADNYEKRNCAAKEAV